jgi:transcription elongation factor GreB
MHSAAVAQLDRVLGYEPRGRGFDSCQPHHIEKLTTKVVGFFSLWVPYFALSFLIFCEHAMSKAFTKETDADDDDEVGLPALPTGTRNYMTPAGYARLRAELFELIDGERPKVVEIVHWAASNGDRSENGDYIYGKKRLREIDRRIRFLTKRLEVAEVVDPAVHHGHDQVFFGATVTYAEASGTERTVTILGIDEADSLQGQVSWVSPIARTLLKSKVGDELNLVTPSGVVLIEVLQVTYPAPA